ncbi:hypothetical protein SAMN05421821_116136 [Mucilaginibacter lappiensis]|uniref:Uncharacterized protein n=1 Tax=Mucilaginibacter lappiensis TaxID=354630 RepID=A0ABR6PQP3_9SPHI|nr:hypothetical protein [Mucilaginibacter lappiensis]SIR95531.1 hypothetical protein SAMN05421821_116136 [Mucilaginibacter lappiensis]
MKMLSLSKGSAVSFSGGIGKLDIKKIDNFKVSPTGADLERAS